MAPCTSFLVRSSDDPQKDWLYKAASGLPQDTKKNDKSFKGNLETLQQQVMKGKST